MRKKHAKESKVLSAWGKSKSMQVLAACGLLLGAGMMQSCDKDNLTGQPEWLGNSIYERLQEGITVNDGSTKSFTTMLRLIDDLGYTTTLSKTGSKTLFATPDDVYDQWFKDNNLTYDQLTTAQKKALFNGAMINNAYLLELMSSVSGNPPQEGLCVRRETAATIYDSIPVYRLADMPVNPLADEEKDAWAHLRSKGQDVRMFKDATSSTMMHFLPQFMTKSRITDNDLSIITNGVAANAQESWINGKQVISAEQTCKNGYVYVINGVMEGNKNMAEIVNSEPDMSMWASFLKRWSCPVAITGNNLREYQSLFNTQDTVYNLRYFNADGGHKLVDIPNSDMSLLETDVLAFDPGWNRYIYQNTQGKDYHYDGGAMFVPTNEALSNWWNGDEGRGLREQYGTWENVPIGTLAKLVNVNMQESFIESVPSKFNAVLDDGKQNALGIDASNIVKSYMGSNGVVYLVNKVFAPVMYRSVMAPALHQSSTVTALGYSMLTGNYPTSATAMTVDNTLDYTPYLNAMDSRFTIVLPLLGQESFGTTTTAQASKVVRYIDPCSYGLAQQNLFEFSFSNNVIKGVSYKCTIDENGVITLAAGNPTNLTPAVIKNRLYDLIDNNIIVHDTEKGETKISDDRLYYNTKAGSIVKVYKHNGATNFEGGYQMDYGQTVSISTENTYDMTASNGNGVTYFGASGESDNVIDMPLTATKSVYQTLKEESEKEGSKCKLFYKLLADDESTNSLLTRQDGSYKCANNTANYNVSIFDNYNYTVYVPTDDKIQELISDGLLPTWDDYAATSDETVKEKIAERIHDFVRYHIQDRAVCIGGEKFTNENFESAKLNPVNNRYYSFRVTADNNNYTVTDQLGNVRHVLKNESNNEFYNKICREYWIKGTLGQVTGNSAATLESSSNAVVHMIDGVLLYERLSRWK